MPTGSIVGIVIQARDEATSSAAAERIGDETLNAIRTMIRLELRRCGLRPPTPPGPGAWRWDPDADAWVPLLGPPDVAARQPARESA